jgi:hypothetical protein
VLPTLGVYDVVYLGDVVEHQSKARAWALLDEAVRHARQAAIVTIPIGDNWPQEMGWDGNTYHAHRSVWEPEDFDRYPDATRHAFSDFIGRTFLVVELTGQAGEARPRSLTAMDREVAAAGVSEDAVHLPPELLQRLDENLSCRALADNPGLNIDLSGSLICQLPATSEIQRCLERLESERLPWVPPLVATVDALFKHCVDVQGMNRPGSRDLAPSPHVVEVLERLAAALSSLVAHAHSQDGIAVGR